jgi:4'-phosphopantetheinyl transferase
MGQNLTFEFFDFDDKAESLGVPQLPSDTIHIWRRSLEVAPTTLESATSQLSGEERERASRFRAEMARGAFILTRSALRVLLAGYLGESPQSIQFHVTKYGKPFLDERFDLHFNVSHTEGLATLAFVRKRRIGIDVEKIRSQPDSLKLARRFFSESERVQLEKLPAHQLSPAFFRCWSRKEAYIKARGEGLSHPLDQFDVSVAASPDRLLISARPDPEEALRWQFRDVPVPAHYVAAVAVSAAEE